MKNSNTKIICLTPVKNESWILDKFIQSASLWADYIIIADQYSDDGSQEIAKKYEKVIFVENKSKEFNEPERQKLLISEARKIEGKKLLIALDADEILSGNAWETEEWEEMLNAPEGTVFKFKWPFIYKDFKRYWSGEKATMPFAFMDDGTEHKGEKIHSVRIPYPKNAKIKEINEFSIMHYQFTDWERMQSKHRWYQCYERINFPKKSIISIYRMYHHMDLVDEKDMKEIPNEWFENYNDYGIGIRNVTKEKEYRWDKEVDEFIKKYGKSYFKNIDLIGNNTLVLKYLRKTQKKSNTIFIRIIDKILRKIGV